MLTQSTLTDPTTPEAALAAASRAGWDIVAAGDPVTLRRGSVLRDIPQAALVAWAARGCPERDPVDDLAVLYALPGTRAELRRRLAPTYDVRGLARVLAVLLSGGWIEDVDGVLREPEPEL